MSQEEIERFVGDLKNSEALRTGLSETASGVGSVVAYAKDNGYDISADEASAYISAQAGRDLSDQELDAVAGGKGHHHATNSVNVQTVATATTEATVAETTTGVAAEAEVAAVAAVVLT